MKYAVFALFFTFWWFGGGVLAQNTAGKIFSLLPDSLNFDYSLMKRGKHWEILNPAGDFINVDLQENFLSFYDRSDTSDFLYQMKIFTAKGDTIVGVNYKKEDKYGVLKTSNIFFFKFDGENFYYVDSVMPLIKCEYFLKVGTLIPIDITDKCVYIYSFFQNSDLLKVSIDKTQLSDICNSPMPGITERDRYYACKLLQNIEREYIMFAWDESSGKFYLMK